VEFTQIFRDVLILLSVIIAVPYVIGFTKFGKAYKIFTLYLLYVAVIQIALFFYSLEKANSIHLFHYYFIGQFICLSLFYRTLLRSKWVIGLFGIVALFIGYSYVNEPRIFYEYHTFGAVLSHSAIVVYALVYYYRMLSRKGKFLMVNTGVLIYFLSSSLYYASGNLVIALGLPKETQRYIGLINDFLYLSFLIIVFWEWYRNFRVGIAKKENN